MGILAGGGYTSQVTIHERQAMPVPSGTAVTDAAAIPEVWLTAWDALVGRNRPLRLRGRRR